MGVSTVRPDSLERATNEFAAVFGDGTISLRQLRKNLDSMMTRSHLESDVDVTPVTLGGVGCLRVSAGVVDDKVLIWFHGGGYVMGSPQGYTRTAAAVSRALRAAVVVPDYRLAPEHPFPAALEDAVRVVEALSADLGAERLAVAGDSAGGGLTLAVLVALRERGRPRPAAAVAVSPLADFTASGNSMSVNEATDRVIRPQSLPMLAASYLGRRDRKMPLASPVFAPLHDLPPLLLLASGTETLLDDAVRIAAKVREAGGEHTLSIYPDTCHAWTLFSDFLPQAKEGVAEIASFVRKAWS